LRLTLKRRGKRRLLARLKAPVANPARATEVWSADFAADAQWSGRRYRTFSVIDVLNREDFRIEIDASLPARRIVQGRTGYALLVTHFSWRLTSQ
jgi:putative transposase